MSRTKVIIGYLPPLLALEDPELELFITKLVTFETNTDQWGMPIRFCKLREPLKFRNPKVGGYASISGVGNPCVPK